MKVIKTFFTLGCSYSFSRYQGKQRHYWGGSKFLSILLRVPSDPETYLFIQYISEGVV